MNSISQKLDRDRIGFFVLMAIAAPCLYFGWKLFWFLTDDSFILFRYISNSILGHGYVWNPPPFQPVEGYTSLLWVALLDTVWRLTGVEPPVSSNYLSLFFSYSTLLLSSVMVMKLQWASSIKKYRLLFLFLFLVFLLSNRSFLAWTSSGLETAMFCFFITLWVYALLYARSPLRRILWGAIAAVAIELTRPEGILFCVGTTIISVLWYWYKSEKRKTILLAGIFPLIVTFLHFLWRYYAYGAWFPNTYYAKVGTPWPLSGSVYAFSFIMEYGLWICIISVTWYFLSAFRRKRKASRENGRTKTPSSASQIGRRRQNACNIVVFLSLVAQFAYYTFIVGGDHFEYRVYNHFIPLIFFVFLWVLNRLQIKLYLVFILLFSQIVLSLPVQWTHWALTKDLKTRSETFSLYAPTATAWPLPFRVYFGIFDKAQSWLIGHFVCIRHQEHKIFSLTHLAEYPSRATGEKISSAGFPVLPVRAVGVPSWVLPNIYILDGLGLNDYVVARTPIHAKRRRLMAHSRRPLDGYIESYRPNVSVHDGEVEIHQRRKPLTDSEIRRLESYWRSYIATLDRSALEKQKTENIPTGNERILFVEDELPHAKRGKQLLEGVGYGVEIVSSSADALELIRETPDYFDLIVADIMMMEIAGSTLAQKINRIRTDLPVLISAGFDEYYLLNEKIESGDTEYIIKPFEIGDLFSIREVLDGTETRSMK